MAHMDDDFEARFKRVKARTAHRATIPRAREVDDAGSGELATAGAILRPALALVLGVVALILGRAVAMNQFMVEASPDLLSPIEGALILPLLVVFGLLLGRSQVMSQVAMIAGAVLAFLCERYYVPVVPDLMAAIYTPGYVETVLLGTL